MCLFERKLVGIKEHAINFISCFVQIQAHKFCTYLGIGYSVKILYWMKFRYLAKKRFFNSSPCQRRYELAQKITML